MAIDVTGDDVTVLQREMTTAMRAMLGRGFVPDYYRQMAGDFVATALWFIDYLNENESKEKPMASVRNTRSTVTVVVYNCPVCEVDVTGRIAVDIDNASTTDYDAGKSITLTGTKIGCQVDAHDCVPKTTR